MTRKNKGWRGESRRHSLASRGIKTGSKTYTPTYTGLSTLQSETVLKDNLLTRIEHNNETEHEMGKNFDDYGIDEETYIKNKQIINDLRQNKDNFTYDELAATIKTYVNFSKL